MYWTIVLLFLVILYLLSMRKESMENKSNAILGPITADIYGPTFRPPSTHKKRCKHRRPHNEPIPEDDGTHRSDIATKQFAIYFYKPFATLPFPTSPPPQPYLNDFKVFQH
jgi:hypothetical protein